MVVVIGFGLEQYNFFSHIGFGCLGLSYLCTNIVHLRACICLANVWLVVWGIVALQQWAAYSAAGWNSLFFLINLRRLYQAWKARPRKADDTAAAGVHDESKAPADGDLAADEVAAEAAVATPLMNKITCTPLAKLPASSSPRSRHSRPMVGRSPLAVVQANEVIMQGCLEGDADEGTVKDHV